MDFEVAIFFELAGKFSCHLHGSQFAFPGAGKSPTAPLWCSCSRRVIVNDNTGKSGEEGIILFGEKSKLIFCRHIYNI